MATWKDIKRSIILASQSPRRKELLSLFSLPFSIQVQAVKDEAAFFRNYPLDQALHNLSIAKAQGVADENPSHLVIGADTVIIMDEHILGKPSDYSDAFQTLRSLSGRTHTVMTGVALLCKECDYQHCSVETTKVYFRSNSDEDIKRYLSYGTYTDKAGSYAIQDQGTLLVDYIEGCYNNVVGLPTTLLQSMLNRFSQIDGKSHE